jgi:hypothetical protein
MAGCNFLPRCRDGPDTSGASNRVRPSITTCSWIHLGMAGRTADALLEVSQRSCKQVSSFSVQLSQTPRWLKQERFRPLGSRFVSGRNKAAVRLAQVRATWLSRSTDKPYHQALWRSWRTRHCMVPTSKAGRVKLWNCGSLPSPLRHTWPTITGFWTQSASLTSRFPNRAHGHCCCLEQVSWRESSAADVIERKSIAQRTQSCARIAEPLPPVYQRLVNVTVTVFPSGRSFAANSRR